MSGRSWGSRWGGTGGWAWRGRRKKGEEGESGLESWAAVAVVWASRTLLGDCGWGSGLQLLAVKFREAGVGFGFEGAVFALGVPRPFPRGEGDTLIPPS